MVIPPIASREDQLHAGKQAILAASPLNPAFTRLATEGATGYLLFGGANFGLQAGGGVTGFAGVMYAR